MFLKAFILCPVPAVPVLDFAETMPGGSILFKWTAPLMASQIDNYTLMGCEGQFHLDSCLVYYVLLDHLHDTCQAPITPLHSKASFRACRSPYGASLFHQTPQITSCMKQMQITSMPWLPTLRLPAVECRHSGFVFFSMTNVSVPLQITFSKGQDGHSRSSWVVIFDSACYAPLGGRCELQVTIKLQEYSLE